MASRVMLLSLDDTSTADQFSSRRTPLMFHIYKGASRILVHSYREILKLRSFGGIDPIYSLMCQAHAGQSAVG
ncbi:hypothetical protein I7I53_09318 [Histoplasma capsulatum var. duboisii H88]|uniref:Uncharacterized protein n=1 Tax=Ajellomyces capsulatus (strain H88) TaxID=544711 RepID=A0A8A1L8R9_AJEC8|nr:hypothetical protein I7I53_09318 [Histoplasma capsulatum var. duboisii H88]